jgi:hypothetical protein
VVTKFNEVFLGYQPHLVCEKISSNFVGVVCAFLPVMPLLSALKILGDN